MSPIASVHEVAGFAAGPAGGAAAHVGSRSYAAGRFRAARPLVSRQRGGSARRELRMVLDPAHVDAFVAHAPLLGESLPHAPGAFLELARVTADSASLSPADETLQTMINAVDIGPGSEALQQSLSVLVNTPGIRQFLQLVLPPLSVVATSAIDEHPEACPGIRQGSSLHQLCSCLKTHL